MLCAQYGHVGIFLKMSLMTFTQHHISTTSILQIYALKKKMLNFLSVQPLPQALGHAWRLVCLSPCRGSGPEFSSVFFSGGRPNFLKLSEEQKKDRR